MDFAHIPVLERLLKVWGWGLGIPQTVGGRGCWGRPSGPRQRGPGQRRGCASRGRSRGLHAIHFGSEQSGEERKPATVEVTGPRAPRRKGLQGERGKSDRDTDNKGHPLRG